MDCIKSCEHSIRLINRLKEVDRQNQLDYELINKAICWARKYHTGQFRKSGEPFYTHPLEVAYMIVEYSIKTDVIVASILHDIVEDTEVTVGMISDNFSHRIAEMVNRLTRDRPDGSKLTVAEILNNAYQLGDEGVLLIKLMDRIHNANTVHVKSLDKIKKLVDDTLENFITLTAYLNLFEREQELTNLCILLSQSNTNYKPIRFSPVKKDTYQLPVLDFQNEINQIYNLKL